MAASIPYVVAPHYELPWLDAPWGPFGMLVALGVFLGWRWCLHFAKTRDIDDFYARDTFFWCILWAFLLAHWVSVIFYFPERLKEDPWVLLYILNGLSSVGGFLGAFFAMNWFLRKHKQPVLIYGDMLMMGLLVGWCFGRMGCAWVHDHPGQIVAADTFLAVGPWPCSCDGGGRWLPSCCSAAKQVFRYDLGLYEFGVSLWLLLYVNFFFKWKTAHPGRLTGIIAVVYAPSRFLLDFLREDAVTRGVSTPDVRYAGLTFAQYVMIAMLGTGLWLLLRKPDPRDLEYAKESEYEARKQAEKAEKAGKARTTAGGDGSADRAGEQTPE